MSPREGGPCSGDSSNQKSPYHDRSKDGQTNGIADHSRFADIFLFLHCDLSDMYSAEIGGLVSRDLRAARLFSRSLFLRHHLFGGFVARGAQLHK